GNGPGGGLAGAGRAYKVSYNRPFITRGSDSGEDWLFNAEYPMVRWLERNAYDVAYFTGVDADRRGAEIARHKIYLSVGHDEYWSKIERANVELARDQGFSGQAAPVNLAFFSGNEIFWKTRWEPSIDPSATAYRTLVCYKETHAGAKIDPSPEWTGSWRDPRFSPPSDGGRPENALSGTIFMVNGERTDSLVVPAADAQMRFWRNTPTVSHLSGTQSWTGAAGTLGYEWDEDLDNGSRPAGLVALSTAVVDVPGLLQDYGSTYAAGTATHHMVFHKRTNGALVFGAGTVQWPWGLDANHDRSTPPVSVDMQQATVNLFADMGVQPATLQTELIPASASADLTAPVSDITSPASNATFPVGTSVTIAGTAADAPPGQVGAVEVSVDGGVSWHPAQGRGSWSYAWTPAQAGTVTILSRAIDDSGNIELPGSGVSVVVTGSALGSIWAGGGSPATINDFDGQEIELGVKFRSSSAGQVTAVRFYKASLDGGTHTVKLWSATGTLLGSGTSTGESASGWQQVTLSSAVAIAANTTYVASYHAQPGYYVSSTSFFTQAVTNGPLTALADGTDGPNGVYKYGPSAFPTQSYSASNYWVDVAFTTQPPPPDTTPPTVVSVAPAANSTGVGVNTAVTATFSEPLAVATVNATTVLLKDPTAQLVPATVTWNATTNTATLQPASALLPLTTYTATVKGITAGGPEGASVGVTDVAGNPLAADFNWTFTTGSGASSGLVSVWGSSGTPTSLNLNDGQQIELGVKFRSSQAGYISAIRFYKGNLDTGTHTGSLWSSTGTLLGTASFSAESATGWQQVSLASAVPIAANTTYVASYHSNAGYYVATSSFFTQAVTNPPLTALADGTDGPNGLYNYGPSGFPTQSFNQTNYWVDVVFSVNPPGPDVTPPTILATTPTSNAAGVAVTSTVLAQFSEPLATATITATTFQLKDPSGQVLPATVAWDPTTNTATLRPTSVLGYSTAYTAVVKGGSGGVTDVAGNPLAADVTWTFTTQALPPPPPDDGPGGPLLVISYSGNPFSRYFAEILRAEGLNAFKAKDISTVDATTLAQYDLAILGDMPLTAAQATMLSSWVNAGGNLIAM
ncbi:MAG TPA: DUF4082 domain-containing protein, partial [Vicinamibacteria bacterium]|nr:DUF4082 domain-containing protein [Vicinamibacteria bacterium]